MSDAGSVTRTTTLSAEAAPLEQGGKKDDRSWPPITAVICCLNEAPNLVHVLPRMPSYVEEILLVDGHSTDGTVEVARNLKPEIRVLYQEGRGKGDAMRYGVEQATGDIIVTLDADGETDPADMATFIEPLLRGYDFVKGSRFANGWKHKPLHRLAGNFVIAMTCNLLYGTRFSDICSGYNAFWRHVLERTYLWSDDGWNYEPLLIARVLRSGLKVVEVPQTFRGRIGDESKLDNWGQGSRAIRALVSERFSGPKKRPPKD